MMSRKFEILPQFTVIRDTYTVDRFLGEGAFGVVYKVRHKFLGIQALKVFHPEKSLVSQVNDFFNEAIILSKMTHPNVVRVFEANHFDWKDQSVAYVAMEYVPDGTLDGYIRQKVRVEQKLAVRIMMMICRGLSQAHQQQPPIIHRDIKPQNIMLDCTKADLIAKVSDFGQALHVDPLTKLAQSAGTLAYMAPEGFWNYKSPASDVYSAGMIFYIMLTGVAPFKMPISGNYKDSKDVERAIRKARNVTPKVPSEFNVGIDSRLDQIVLKALEQKVENRYQDAGEFLLVLEHYVVADGESLEKRIDEVLVLGRQYRDLPEAIQKLEAILQSLPESQRQTFCDRYGVFLDSWKKGIIM
jgi:serine/threonine protein kinase